MISAEKYPHGVEVGISDDASKNEEERATTAVNDDHGDIVEGSEGDEGGRGSEEDLEEVESLAESIEEAFSSDDENTLGATAGLDSSVTETDTEAKAEAEAAVAAKAKGDTREAEVEADTTGETGAGVLEIDADARQNIEAEVVSIAAETEDTVKSIAETNLAAIASKEDNGDIIEGDEVGGKREEDEEETKNEKGKGSEEDLEEVESLAESIEEAFSSDDENTLGATAGLDSSVTETDTEAKAEAEATAAGETAEHERTDAKAKGLSDEEEGSYEDDEYEDDDFVEVMILSTQHTSYKLWRCALVKSIILLLKKEESFTHMPILTEDADTSVSLLSDLPPLTRHSTAASSGLIHPVFGTLSSYSFLPVFSFSIVLLRTYLSHLFSISSRQLSTLKVTTMTMILISMNSTI